jgi:hypothetical protein
MLPPDELQNERYDLIRRHGLGKRYPVVRKYIA